MWGKKEELWKKGSSFFYIQNHIFTIFDKKLEYIAENQDLNQKNREKIENELFFHFWKRKKERKSEKKNGIFKEK